MVSWYLIRISTHVAALYMYYRHAACEVCGTGVTVLQEYGLEWNRNNHFYICKDLRRQTYLEYFI